MRKNEVWSEKLKLKIKNNFCGEWEGLSWKIDLLVKITIWGEKLENEIFVVKSNIWCEKYFRDDKRILDGYEH